MMLPFSLLSDADLSDSFLLLLAGLLLDAIVGEMPWLFVRVPHPVIVIGGVVTVLECNLNHSWCDPVNRCWRGVITVGIMVVVAAAVGMGGHGLATMCPYAWGLEVFLIGVLVAQRSLYQHVAAVAHGFIYKGLYGGQVAVARICGREPSGLDEAGIARAAIESCAENFNDGVVAPVFWYALLGLPGLMIYKTVNTLDSMIGHRNERYQSFGFAAARLDDLLSWIPARIAGLLITSAAIFVPTARPLAALVIMIRDARKHRSPNAGWPESAMAGALGLVLGGPRDYPDYKVEGAWLGIDTFCKEPQVRDIGRALRVLVLAYVMNAAMILTVWYTLVRLSGLPPRAVQFLFEEFGGDLLQIRRAMVSILPIF